MKKILPLFIKLELSVNMKLCFTIPTYLKVTWVRLSYTHCYECWIVFKNEFYCYIVLFFRAIFCTVVLKVRIPILLDLVVCVFTKVADFFFFCKPRRHGLDITLNITYSFSNVSSLIIYLSTLSKYQQTRLWFYVPWTHTPTSPIVLKHCLMFVISKCTSMKVINIYENNTWQLGSYYFWKATKKFRDQHTSASISVQYPTFYRILPKKFMSITLISG